MADDIEKLEPSIELKNEPVKLLQQLIRFDTSNPPGNEKECVEWIESLLSEAGYKTELYAKDSERPNLFATLTEDTENSPLLLYGHVDVVPANADDWEYPPFKGKISDGSVWGRGSLDMKGGVSMMLSAALRFAEEISDAQKNLAVMILSDEEAGGDYGARYMTEAHPELFDDIEYAIGEFGGFSLNIAGNDFVPIQMSEKIVCWSKLKFEGPKGHGSLPTSESALIDMCRAAVAIDTERLPVHITPIVEQMIRTVSSEIPPEQGDELKQLIKESNTDEILNEMDGGAQLFDAILHNTANITAVNGGEQENVIPPEAELTIDGRLLPGQNVSDFKRELREVIPEDIEYSFEQIRYEPFPAETDERLFNLLSDILKESEISGTPIPFVVFGSSDARHLARVNVQSYGFLPMNLPDDFEFLEKIHSTNEKIPVDTVEFGAKNLYEAVKRYENVGR